MTAFPLPLFVAPLPLPRLQTASPPARAPRCCAADPRHHLSATQLQHWQQLSDLLCALPPVESAIQPDLADTIIRRAFGWSSQRYWRRAVLREPPHVPPVEQRLRFLTDRVGLAHHQLQHVVRRFPEVLRMDLHRLERVVAFIENSFPAVRADRLASAVLQKPSVLGFDFDCDGDCQGECSRCWAQF